MGSARKVFDTKPPSVARAQPAKNRTKNSSPRAIRAWGDIGVSGFTGRNPICRRGVPHRQIGRSLDETRISEAREVRDFLDDAGLLEQRRRFLHEGRELGREELLVR